MPLYDDVPPEVEVLFVKNVDFGVLIAYAHTCQKARCIVQSLLQLRCQRLLKPYLDVADMDEFWRAVNAGRGGITGCAAVWVTQHRPLWSPRDIKIAVKTGGHRHLRTFLLDRGWTEYGVDTQVRSISASRPYLLRSVDAYPADPPYIDRTWRFWKPGTKEIMLTETPDENVFEYLTGAPNTMTTMLLTSTTILALHAFECIRKFCIWRRGPAEALVDSSAAGMAYEMGGCMDYLSSGPSSCRSYCPGLLRRLRGGRGIGLLRWRVPPTGQSGGVDKMDIDRVGADAYKGFSASEYALGWTWCTCENPDCDTFLFPRNIFPALPPSVSLSCNPKEDVILRTAHAVRTCQPPFPHIYQGLLFATSCRKPFLVPVPLDHGLRDYRFPDDLRAYTWISRRIPGTLPLHMWWPPYETVGGTTDFRTLTYRYRGLLLFMACVHKIGPVNIALGENIQPRPVHGDVLVMLENDGKIVDLTLEDVPQIVKRIEPVWTVLASQKSLRNEK
ncbi:hypothetical protein B0H12DRAFT_1244282 [Mycena haematopus]|nr:hypothetical protein B0H12DRAFT_1244282 [Mycena haematopus]